MLARLMMTLLLPSLLALTACRGPQTAIPTAVPGQTENLPDNERQETFHQAYKIAVANAKDWSQDALLYQIPSTAIMEQNFGLPGVSVGWFFMFQQPGNPVEYYVLVVDGNISGSREAQQITDGTPSLELERLDLQGIVFDDVDALVLFMEQGGDDYARAHPDFWPDFRLIHVKGLPHPVWSIYDGSDVSQPALFHLDAVTGQIASDPVLPN